jgi:hypothetical protein
MMLEIWSLAPRAARELRVIKAHFAIALCSVGCLTLHLTSGFCWPCSTGNRELNKLQRGTPGMGEEESVGRKQMLGVEMGFHTLVCILTALAFHYSRTTGLRESR